MSPFRDAPQVELGPLDVGLGEAATRAMIALPSGGRLVSSRSARVATHTTGALGSVGLLGVAAAAFVAWTSRWHPESLSDIALCIIGIIGGGLSLAAILRAMDRTSRQLTQPGELVGRGARRVLGKLAGLAERAERAPDGLDADHVAALREALSAAVEPEIARWIPTDVRGRGELLLARAETRRAGLSWARDQARRERIRTLLMDAKNLLADPRPAEADLAALDQSKAAVRAPLRRRVRLAVVIGPSRAASSSSPREELTEEEPFAASSPRIFILRR